MSATLDRLLRAVHRRQPRGVELATSPDTEAARQDEEVRGSDDPAAAKFVSFLHRFDLSLARDGDPRELAEAILAECEREKESVTAQLASARDLAVKDGGGGPAARVVRKLEAQLDDLDEIESRVFGKVRPAFVRGEDEGVSSRVACRFFSHCRTFLGERDAWNRGGICDDCRRAAAARPTEGGDELDRLLERI